MQKQIHAACLPNGSIMLGKRYPGQDPLHHVGQIRHRQVRILRQRARSQIVQALSNGGDFLTQQWTCVGEGKAVETRSLRIDRTIFELSTDGKRPRPMDPGRQHAQHEGIVRRDADQPIIRQYRGVLKPEPTVFGRLYRHNEARQSFQGPTKFSSRLAKNPPVVTIGRPVVCVPVRFHSFHQMLHEAGMLSDRLVLRPSE